ncbi:uncharacterized protein LOC129311258 isoform X1 [Prosopis cineraria]|uniref:uncharacterized protein LOC129311258 isoform X1 n=2 Tax=Prosopis cineraria TaxID=364024 RepID=UPI00240F0115|nr:uncharacterized protein LOC129311258 isoform X1 [Prosopis cineraria]
MQGFIAGKGNSKRLEMYADTFNQRKNDKHVKTCPESPSSGSGSSKHSHSKPEVIDGIRSSTGSEGQIDVIASSERALEGHESNCPETHANDTGGIWEPVRRSGSSSSSESSLNDVFEVETVDFESKTSRPASKNQQNNDISSHSSSSSEGDDKNSPVPTSTCVPPPVSPPVQVMDLSGGYDPNRIPSSIFARNNTSPIEWSTASNESLFSIHLGNYSFSRDHASAFDDLYKSGELTKSGELRSQPSFVIPEDIELDHENVDKEDLLTNNMLDEAFESENRSNGEKNKAKSSQPDTICNSRNVSGRSHCSGTSTCSFAFPILIEADRFSAHKADVSPRHSEKEPYVPPKEDASELASRSTAKRWNWLWCFSWSSCWTRGKCCSCRC